MSFGFKTKHLRGSKIQGEENGFKRIVGQAELKFDLGVNLLVGYSILDDNTLGQSFKIEVVSN